MMQLWNEVYRLYAKEKFGDETANLDKLSESARMRWVALFSSCASRVTNPLTAENVFAEIKRVEFMFQFIADFNNQLVRDGVKVK